MVFEEIGEMAPQLMYVHVLLPLNITTIYEQAAIYKAYLKELANSTTTDYTNVPYTKAVRDGANYGIRKIDRIVKKLRNLDLNLPHVDSRHKREADFADFDDTPNYYNCRGTDDDSYLSSTPIENLPDSEKPDVPYRKKRSIHDQTFDYAGYQNIMIQRYTNEINQILKGPEKPDYPEEFWEAHNNSQLHITKFRSFEPQGGEDVNHYLGAKLNRLVKIHQCLEKEQGKNATLPDIYLHHRDPRFITAAISLISDVVGTFMGAFNAYEIKQLKLKFHDLSEKHNTLVRITETNSNHINDIHKTLRQMVDLVHAMAKFNPALIMMQIDEQIQIFQDRVTIVRNAIQQLHHRRLAVDLLEPEQMEILHSSVEAVAQEAGFHNQAKYISDYFQIEATYLRTGDDIVIMLHVPCIKSKALLKIYKYLPFPITLPFTPKAHDMTIRQSLDRQYMYNLPQQQLDAIFDQNNLDHPQYPEALFITDKTDIIAIGADNSFQILSQMDLANCVQRNHVYLCDRNTVVQTDLTDSCLGSLYLRQEEGVRKHCKFERRPVQEIVYQLTDTEHLVYSPVLQTASIVCRNNTHETVYLDQSTRITVPQGCSLSLQKHRIHSERQTTISPHPLHGAWNWDPLSLPSTLLADPEHLDHLLYELRTDFNTIDQKFIAIKNLTSSISSPDFFTKMLVDSTYSTNSTSILIWTALCLSAIANLYSFLQALFNFLQRRRQQLEQLELD